MTGTDIRLPRPMNGQRLRRTGDWRTHPECPTGQAAEYPVSSINCSPSESGGGLLLSGLGFDETGSLNILAMSQRAYAAWSSDGVESRDGRLTGSAHALPLDHRR